MTIEEVKNYVLVHLNKNMLIQVYDSRYSTYVRFEGGLCNSLRISNHKSNKNHLNYLYNVRTDLDYAEEKVTQSKQGFLRYHYGTEQLDELITDINGRFDLKRSGVFTPMSTYKEDMLRRLNEKTHLNVNLKLVQLGDLIEVKSSMFV